MNYTNTFFESLLHLVYPRTCAGCGSDILSRGQQICLDCMLGLPLTGFFEHAGNPVEKIFYGRLPVSDAGAFMYFVKQSMVQQLLHELKYKGNTAIGHYLGKMMGESLARSGRFANIDAVVPMPLFGVREKRRGYNQSVILGGGIAEVLKVPQWLDVIKRKRNTNTQTRKSRLERWDNMEGGFELLKSTPVANAHVLLVDDVITTGATIEACGTALLRAAGLRLSVASLAYTAP